MIKLSEIICANLYDGMLKVRMEEYEDRYNKIKNRFPVQFVRGYEDNFGYHDWTLSEIKYVNYINIDRKCPSVSIELRHLDDCIKIVFCDANKFELTNEIMRKHYVPYAEDLIVMLFDIKGNKKICECLFAHGLKLHIEFLKLEWVTSD